MDRDGKVVCRNRGAEVKTDQLKKPERLTRGGGATATWWWEGSADNSHLFTGTTYITVSADEEGSG